MSEIIQDQTPIKCLSYDTEDGACFSTDGGFKIEAYGEPREYCEVAFFRVTKNGQMVARVPATHVTVVYEAPNAQ